VGFYTELFYAIIPTPCFYAFLDLRSLHLATFLKFFILVLIIPTGYHFQSATEYHEQFSESKWSNLWVCKHCQIVSIAIAQWQI